MPTARVETGNATLEAQVFWMRYRKEIVALIALALIALIIFGIYRFYSERRQNNAAAMFARSKTAADYQQLLNHYGDTLAAASAYLLLAEEQRKAQQYQEANSTLQTFIEKFPRHELVSSARMAIAGNFEAMGKQDEALTMYQQIATANSGGFNTPFALLAQAQILKSRGRDDDARRVLETLLSQHQGSYATLEGMRLLRTLKPATIAAPAQTSSPATAATAQSPP